MSSVASAGGVRRSENRAVGPVNGVSPTLGVWIEGNTRSFGVSYLRNLRPIDIRQVRRLPTTETLHTYNWPWGGLVITLR